MTFRCRYGKKYATVAAETPQTSKQTSHERHKTGGRVTGSRNSVRRREQLDGELVSCTEPAPCSRSSSTGDARDRLTEHGIRSSHQEGAAGEAQQVFGMREF